MDDATRDDATSRSRRNRRLAGATGLLAAGAVAGIVLAGTTSASAATSTSTANGSNSAAPAAAGSRDHGGANPVRGDEKSVSAAVAAKLKAAALKAVPGGTVYRVEADAGDGVYEAHMTKADGTEVTVKFDKNLAVTKVETGMGTGDPAPSGGQNRQGDHQRPANGTPPTPRG